MKAEKYWMVHSPKNGQPNFQHTSFQSADTEAKRLAKLHKGDAFYVLEPVKGYCLPEPEPEEIELETSDDVPF